MIKHYFFLYIILMSALMTGCTTAPPSVPTPPTYVAMPSSLLLPCQAVRPPNKTKYKSGTWDEKEKMLVDVINLQNGVISKCNIQIMGGADWNAKQKAVFEKKKEEP